MKEYSFIRENHSFFSLELDNSTLIYYSFYKYVVDTVLGTTFVAENLVPKTRYNNNINKQISRDISIEFFEKNLRQNL